MIERYNKFLNANLITEEVKNTSTSSAIKDMVDKAKKSIENIRYKLYNNFPNDDKKTELAINGTYYTIVRFEPKKIDDNTKSIQNFMFKVKIQLTKQTVKEATINNETAQINVFEYKILEYDQSMIKYKQILDKNINDIKLFLNTKNLFMKQINPLLVEKEIYGYYIFTKIDKVSDTIRNTYRMNQNRDYNGFPVDGDIEKSLSNIKSKVTLSSLYKNKVNTIFVILKLPVENTIQLLDTADQKTYNVSYSDLMDINKYIPFKNDTTNTQETLYSYIKNKLETYKTEKDTKKLFASLLKDIGVINIYLVVGQKDENISNNLISLNRELYNIFNTSMKNSINNLSNVVNDIYKNKTFDNNIKITKIEEQKNILMEYNNEIKLIQKYFKDDSIVTDSLNLLIANYDTIDENITKYLNSVGNQSVINKKDNKKTPNNINNTNNKNKIVTNSATTNNVNNTSVNNVDNTSTSNIDNKIL